MGRVAVPLLAACALLPWVSTSTGLVAGVITALTLGNPWAKQTKRLSTWLLQGSVVGLGFGTDLGVVLQTGARGVLTTLVSLMACITVGVLLSRALGVARDVGLLLSVGTAICGGSAIAAVVPAIGAKDEDATVSLAVVFLLNAAGLLLFPPIGHALLLGDEAFGTWAALAIHDTSSVVGTTSAWSERALAVGTTLKLTRALWIAPLAFVLGLWAARGGVRNGSAAKMPWFILGFVVAAGVVTAVPALREPGRMIASAARQVLVVTLFLIGANLSRAALRAVGLRPLVLGVVLWVFVAAATLGALRAGWLCAAGC